MTIPWKICRFFIAGIFFLSLSTGFLLPSRRPEIISLTSPLTPSSKSQGVSTDESTNQTGLFRPFQIQLNQVSISFPDSWMQKLFSAVPKRPFALEKIDVSFEEPQLCIITGDSSAGKSTLLRIIAKAEQPTDGACTWETADTPNICTSSLPVPIYLAASTDTTKYESYTNPPKQASSSMSTTFMDSLKTIVLQKMKQGDLVADDKKQERFAQSFSALAKVFFSYSELSAPIADRTLSLSQSQIYRTRLLEASMESILSQQSQAISSDDEVIATAPFLLLDEWLDQETSVVIQSVQMSLERLAIQTNATVFVITHYPERWKLESSSNITKRLILSRGKIISYQ